MPRPLVQRSVNRIGIVVTVIIVITGIISGLHGSLKLISPRVTFWGTAFVLTLYFLTVVLLRIRPVAWKTSDNQLVRINKIGVELTLPFLVLIAIFWLAWFINPIYKLEVRPTHRITGTGQLTPQGTLVIDLWVYNLADEVHNIDGKFSIHGKVISASKKPIDIIPLADGGIVIYYGIMTPYMHKENALELIEWEVIPPGETEHIEINYWIYSSETPNQNGSWVVTRNGDTFRFTGP